MTIPAYAALVLGLFLAVVGYAYNQERKGNIKLPKDLAVATEIIKANEAANDRFGFKNHLTV